MNVHFLTIGTAYNIYHVLFDLLQPLHHWYIRYIEHHTHHKQNLLVLSIGNVHHPSDVDTTLSLSNQYNLPLSTLLSTIVNIEHIISKHSFDHTVQQLATKTICLDQIYIGHPPTGFVHDDFVMQSLDNDASALHPTDADKQRTHQLHTLHTEQLALKRFVLASLLLPRVVSVAPTPVRARPQFRDGLLFLIRQHNRKFTNVDRLIVLARKQVPHVHTIQPQHYSFRTLVEELRRVSMVAVVSGAGVTNLMFMRSGSVVLYVNPLGCFGFTHRSYGRMLPWSNLHVVYLKGKVGVEGKEDDAVVSRVEGWLGSEDEETRLGKDSDVGVSDQLFEQGLVEGKRLLGDGGGMWGNTEMMRTERVEIDE